MLILFCLIIVLIGIGIFLYKETAKDEGTNNGLSAHDQAIKIASDKLEEIELRRKLDLHYGRRDFSSNSNYVEFYFHACFDELFNVHDSSWETELSGNEILEIFELLEIEVDKIYITDSAFFHQNNNAEVFHSRNDELVFAYLDFWKDPTDQNDMFMLGFSCTKEQELVIHPKLLDIYRKLHTSSPFTFDFRNKRLYRKVFHSYSFFYENKYSKYKRQINHHNLEK